MIVFLGLLLFVVPIDEAFGNERSPTALASIAWLLLGLVLLVMAFQRWRNRPKPGEELPAWMTKLEQATPAAAFGLGAVFSGVYPKNLAFHVAAVVAIAQADLTPGETLISCAVYVLIASVGVVAPVIWSFAARESAAATLAGWRVWLAANYGTMMAIVFLLFGVKLLAQGLGGLIG